MSHLAATARTYSSATRLRVVVVAPPDGGAFLTTLAGDPQVVVLTICTGLDQAVDRVATLCPDAVLIDVARGTFDPLELVERGGRTFGDVPLVVAGDAADAVRAFEARALDFLLKPFGADRLRESLSRVRADLRNNRDAGMARRVLGLLQGLDDPTPRMLRLKDQGRVVFVDVGEVDFIEADGNYSIVHAGAVRHIVRQPISRFERELAASFVRVHRSALVNLRRVTEVRRLPNGEQDVALAGGSRVPVSRRLRAALASRLAEGQTLNLPPRPAGSRTIC